MARDETRKLSRSLLQKDKDALAALSAVAGYTTVDKNATVANGLVAETDMTKKQDDVAKDTAALKNAKDDARAAEWAFHNFMLGTKTQVAAQFGNDSNEYQSLGLKKKSEKKKPTSKKANAKTEA